MGVRLFARYETLSGFDATAAETTAGANGFYLFHSAA
jgi:hypothetical protein